jgi:hypothetical protein
MFIVVAILMLFPGVKAMAQCDQCDVPSSCILGTSTQSMEQYPINGQWPVPATCTDTSGSFPCYAWTYLIKGVSPLNQTSILVPVCCPEIKYFIPGGGQPLLPGEGDPTTGFGVGNFQARVMRLAAYPSYPGVYAFYTDKITPLHRTSIQVRSTSKIVYFCRNIAGPDCGLPTYVPVSRTSCVTIENENVCFDFAADGCPIRIYNGDTNIDYPADPSDSTISVSDCGDIFGSQNPNCRMCIRRVDQEGSGGCTNCVVAGRVTRIPTNCCNDALPCPKGKTCGTDGLCH